MFIRKKGIRMKTFCVSYTQHLNKASGIFKGTNGYLI